MTDAVTKTKKLKRMDLPIDKLLPNPENPNEMTTAQFNLLHDNIDRVGITDPILVMKHPKVQGKYLIIGGEHRWEVAKLHDFEVVPCTIIEAKDFDADQARFQTVRHNIIHGRMSPKKFLAMYESLSKKYSDEIAAESFGFVEEEEFKKLINQTAKSLPKELQPDFKEAAKDLKTIDDLSNLMNTMFQNYGDTLDYGYMIVDFGGKESFWLRMTDKHKIDFLDIAKGMRERNKTMDHFIAKLLYEVSSGKLEGFDMDAFTKDMPEVVMLTEVEVPLIDFSE